MYTFFFVASTGFMGYLIISGVLKFLEYDVTSEIRILAPTDGKLRFPMVT
jgi:hypothetical protein